MTEINTKQASRREVHFQDLNSILPDLARLEAAERAGSLVRHGNWTLGQITHHIADMMEQSIDGFRFSAPTPVRVIFSLLRPVILRKPFPAGIALKGESATLIPGASITMEHGLAEFRAQILRVHEGQRITVPSPIFGRLSHDQWARLHCRHAELHLSFLEPEGS